MVLRPAPRAMGSKEAILFFARQQMAMMTPENQARFEKCIELVETDAMPAESLATVVQGMVRQQQRQKANKAPQAFQPDVTLRSGGQGSSAPPPFMGYGAATASEASSGPWTNNADGVWVPFSSNVYYDDATAQWKGIPAGWEAGKGKGGKGQPDGGKGKGGKGNGGKGKKGGKGCNQRVRLSRTEDEAIANVNRFLEEYPTFVFEPRAVESATQSLYQQTGEVHQNLLKQIQRHFVGESDELTDLLKEMVRESHWIVDRNNQAERDRQQRNQYNQDGRSSVSGFSFRSGSTTRT